MVSLAMMRNLMMMNQIVAVTVMMKTKRVVELTPDAVPYHCGKPIRIPHIHMKTLKKEVDRLVEIGVLEVVQGDKAGPWCAPSFITAKKADAEGNQRVRFITDFRELNKYIRRKPWPMPHINDMIQDVGQYKYVTALDLSMGYYLTDRYFKEPQDHLELSLQSVH
jgi:hypothetical protein